MQNNGTSFSCTTERVCTYMGRRRSWWYSSLNMRQERNYLCANRYMLLGPTKNEWMNEQRERKGLWQTEQFVRSFPLSPSRALSLCLSSRRINKRLANGIAQHTYIDIHIQRKGLFILLRLSRCRSSIAFRLFIPMKTRGEELLFSLLARSLNKKIMIKGQKRQRGREKGGNHFNHSHLLLLEMIEHSFFLCERPWWSFCFSKIFSALLWTCLLPFPISPFGIDRSCYCFFMFNLEPIAHHQRRRRWCFLTWTSCGWVCLDDMYHREHSLTIMR